MLDYIAAVVAALVPIDVLEEVGKHTMPAVRARDRRTALIRILVAVFDPAFIFNCRRACSNRQPVDTERRRPLFGERNRLALARHRIFVDLVGKDDAHRAPRKVVRATSASQRQKAAGERLEQQRLVGIACLACPDDLAQDGRHTNQRADTFLAELLGCILLRLQQQDRARIEVREVPEDVFEQSRLQQLGAHHRGDHMHTRLGDRQHRAAGDLDR